MRTISGISILFILVLFCSGMPFREQKVLITIGEESRLYLKGYSNVRNFTCTYDRELLAEAVPVVFYREGKRLLFKKAGLLLENRGFDCGGRGINRDFHGLLKTDEYPEIKLVLKEIIPEKENIHARVSMTIGGEQRDYTVPVTLENGRALKCSGILPLNIRDFGLQPPKKMLGIIVVDEKIDIYFDLFLQVADAG
ncbi:YceI family protein [Sinomicrobium soli]|uniref:YceI family protein n=1 Tax=Sinomicrobium sp. N-1-3-6 TaxID=2219864 RepID=UPI000DCF27A2|nr:YceI family protein [Sinomicrobium sp. N-1-3-6]RAV29065.1 hypothetical protein DN748_09055 [Sinomicrobium sp. N-1-3-6]